MIGIGEKQTQIQAIGSAANPKTAKALGLAIPEALASNKVIE
jgi:hypothetical protein